MPQLWSGCFLDPRRHVEEIFEELIYRRWAIARPSGWCPPLDVHETPDAYLVAVDLPGVAPTEVQILVNEGNLAITGERQPTPQEGAIRNRCERVCGPFRRSLDFAVAVDPEKVQAQCHHGTYRIRLPKKHRTEETAPGLPTLQAESPTLIQVTIC
jgi:HSP20 family molecular chaperone IbpA